MNICWGEPQFPYKVMAGGGIYVFKELPEDHSKPDREVPDTFHLIGEYAKGHSIVLSSSMANSEHIPGLIRGHDASLVMVEHGRFEGFSPYITVKPEKNVVSADYKAKWGVDPIKIPGRRKQRHAGARHQLPELHPYAPESDLECRNRRARTGVDLDGSAELSPGQGAVLRRKELESGGFATQGIARQLRCSAVGAAQDFLGGLFRVFRPERNSGRGTLTG